MSWFGRLSLVAAVAIALAVVLMVPDSVAIPGMGVSDTLALSAFFGMSATNAFENKLLSLYLENADAANIGDAGGLRGSVTAGSLYISLHTGDPGETGNQTTNEAAYTSYARQAVARSTAGWSVTAGVGDNDAAITFPSATGGSETETYFGVGSAVSGTGNLDMYGALTAGLAVSNGITPEFAAGDLDITLD